MRRWLFFLFAILLGIGLGLFIGWVILPVQYTNTTLSTLKTDYQTDYILMVAETYALEHNSASASLRLAKLSPATALEQIHQAILYAEQAGYNNTDLEILRSLQSALAAGAAQSNHPTQ